MKNNTNIPRGIFFIILSAFSFALMSVFVRLSGDIPFIQKTVFRNIGAFIIANISLFNHIHKTHEKIVLTKESALFLILRALAGTIGIFGNFYAIDHIPVADAAILNKMSPFFSVLFCYFILGEKISLVPALALFGAFGGAIFVVKPSFDFSQVFPSVAGFIGGTAAGLAYACLRKLGTLKVNGSLIIAFFSGTSLLIALPYFITNGFAPMTSIQLLFLLGVSVASACGQFCITTAYFSAPAKDISIYDYSIIIFSAIMGFFFFDEIPDIWSFIGYFIIISMALLVFFYNKKKNAHVK